MHSSKSSPLFKAGGSDPNGDNLSPKEQTAVLDSIRKKRRAIVLVGYHYLSTPVYSALKEQLNEFELYYVFTKDTMASDTNYKHFNRDSLRANDPNYVELSYDPPWFRGLMTWHLRTKAQKLWLWIKWLWGFTHFKKEILKLVGKINPDLIITTSDMFFTPRYLAAKLPTVPMVVVQPCYLDLWTREYRYGWFKRIVNILQPLVFERQQYFGLEIPSADLLVWEPAAYENYQRMGRQTIKIVNPTHVSILSHAKHYSEDEREKLLAEINITGERPILSLFTAYYTEIHGHEYQRHLEQSIVEVIKRVQERYHVIVKIHPNEDINYWKSVLRLVDDGNIVILHNFDKFRLMAISDFMISTNSYASVEATLSGTIAVNFVPGMHFIGDEFCSSFNRNAVLTVTSVDDMVNILIAPDACIDRYSNEIKQAQSRIIGDNNGYRSVEEVLLALVQRDNGKTSKSFEDTHNA